MIIAFDTETALFRPGRMAPELACVSWADQETEGLIHWKDPNLEQWLINLFGGNKYDCILAHNTAYDTAVLCAQYPTLVSKIFEAYDKGIIQDTLLNQQIIDIATGEIRGYPKSDGSWGKHQYSLEYTARRYGFGGKEKDEWQLQYGQLRDLPLEKWPKDAVRYPMVDAKLVLEIYNRQIRDYESILRTTQDQARALFALQLASTWGLKTSPAEVQEVRGQTEAEIARLRTRLIEEGLVRVDGTRDTKRAQQRIAAAWQTLGVPPRLTPAGGMQLDEEACLASEDPVLKEYAEYATEKKVLSTDLPILEAGSSTPIHTRFKLLETTRIGSVGPNVQNIRRKPGIRECFSPRMGWCYIDVDYPALELRTLAQTCYEWFGFSYLGEVLNKPAPYDDPHAMVAAVIMGITYEECKRRVEDGDEDACNIRNASKIANFGYPGGMQPPTLCKFAASSYGVHIKLPLAQQIYETFMGTWKEMTPYFKKIRSSKNAQTGNYVIEHAGTQLIRSCSSFNNAANSPFQHLGAACAKHGLWLVTKAAYTDPKSVIYGSRIVNFIHDQLIVEIPYHKWGVQRSSDAAYEVARLFENGAKRFLTKVGIKCKPILCERWSKKAKQVFNDEGLLIPWQYKTNG